MIRTPQDQVIQDIREERARQDTKWGADRDQPHTLWQTILTEEVGEVAEAVLDVTFPKGDAPSAEELKHLYEELVQVAAVATAHAEAVLRQATHKHATPETTPPNPPARTYSCS